MNLRPQADTGNYFAFENKVSDLRDEEWKGHMRTVPCKYPSATRSHPSSVPQPTKLLVRLLCKVHPLLEYLYLPVCCQACRLTIKEPQYKSTASTIL